MKFLLLLIHCILMLSLSFAHVECMNAKKASTPNADNFLDDSSFSSADETTGGGNHQRKFSDGGIQKQGSSNVSSSTDETSSRDRAVLSKDRRIHKGLVTGGTREQFKGLHEEPALRADGYEAVTRSLPHIRDASNDNDEPENPHQKNSYLHASIKLNQDRDITKLTEEEVQVRLEQYASEYSNSMKINVEIARQLSEVDDKVTAQKNVVRKENEKLARLEEEEHLLKEAQQIQLANKIIIGKGLKKCVERLPVDEVSPKLREFADEIPTTEDQKGWVGWAWGAVTGYCVIQ